MRFGPVAVPDAAGAILAHSVGLGPKRLRKGRVLEAADIEALCAAGYAEVTVARLDTDDLHEDDAALALARALVPDPQAAGLALNPVGTGRVNIVAQGPGLLAVNAALVHAVNAIDPAITVATLPDLMRVERGAMAATVKIIAYGVAASAVTRACGAGRGALRLMPPVLRRASLIQTQVQPGEDGAKGHAVTAARLERLGVTLDPLCLVPHQIDPLAQALQQAQGEVVLILTGSATSDLHDTAPEALRRAGGHVVHFGMPVDPGNLLFLGYLGARPVIGLPGCAKSPALNGADWVMERIICGQQVTAADIMAMGVGGLLKEIPTRPRPRRQGEPAQPDRAQD
ncbi:molybdenum cofactor cytidylyltransferase [Roseinatronobacter thiooxidans]|uniref:Molybdenum cofactor cytidylyltransferase n=1 Tax=Roseinatronobacter thiooxidans TaxID=121821 RepID=A0A2W7QA88_9RHOB|nr:molybdopterin-binding protein [Roseinatronobacter thiooxidans]PZX44556.1 molybdenum cofactor cytidylyltransferase [Roseinatronobacter thiooxidans]